MPQKRFFLPLVILTLAAGCVPPPDPGRDAARSDSGSGADTAASRPPVPLMDPPPRGTLERWRLDLVRTDRAWEFALQHMGPEGWASYFTDQGTLVLDGWGEIRGREALQTWLEEEKAEGAVDRFTWRAERAELANALDLGYTLGVFHMEWGDPRRPDRTLRGKYTAVWRMQEDGTWKAEVLQVTFQDQEGPGGV